VFLPLYKLILSVDNVWENYKSYRIYFGDYSMEAKDYILPTLF